RLMLSSAMRHQRLKGLHEKEPDMNAAGVLHLIGSFPSHWNFFIDTKYIDVNILAHHNPSMKILPCGARISARHDRWHCQSVCIVGRTMSSLTSTSAGCSMANATARAMASGSIAVSVRGLSA